MTLDEYEKKRDFSRTPEPAPGRRSGARRGWSFVVHRHEARNLHYDLRLEHGGALCSWAVPKGFSYDPKDKRLAVRTEDHPMEYLEFEGVIPKGQYGAGTMQVWDRGTFELVATTDWDEAMAKGELKVVLGGRKLRGEWHLVKTKQAENTWLLFKSKDRYAGPARDSVLSVSLDLARPRAMPRTVELASAREVRAPFADPHHLFEMEFRGRRLVAEKQGDKVRLRGLKQRPGPVLDALARVAAENALLDGVLIATDGAGRPQEAELERCLAVGELEALQYYAFDLLYFDEFDLRPMRQLDRKGALRGILPQSQALLFVDHVIGDGVQLAATVAQAGLPGVIGKRADAAYGAPGSWCRLAAPAAQVGGDLDAVLSAPAPRRPQGRVRFSNLDKVYWPVEGFTKGDLVRYYEGVVDLLLPHLVGRPVHMLRYPDGIEGKSFYQRQAPEHLPDWFETVALRPEDGVGGEDGHVHMVCGSRDAVLYLVNLGSIDLHPWMSRRGSLASPDYAVIDLDPKGAPFSDVVRVARVVGKVLRGIGVEPVLKTSGKTGLHICIALEPGYTYEQVRIFCEAVARAVVSQVGDLATVERAVGSRGGKVYVDFLQNRSGQTVVPPYVPRPVPGATVSTPLEWDELETDLTPGRFTIQTVVPRLQERGDLFRPVLEGGCDLVAAVERLAVYLGREG